MRSLRQSNGPRAESLRRLIGHTLAFACIGAALTLATAWLCVLVEFSHGYDETVHYDPAISSPPWAYAMPESWPPVEVDRVAGGIGWHQRTQTGVFARDESGPADRKHQYDLTIITYGLPLPSVLTAQAESYPDGRRVQVVRALSLPSGPEFPGISTWTEFPLRPVPLPFLVDTGVWALIAWAVVRIPSATRRASRRRRNLCPRCAYPLTSSPACPECGHPGVPHFPVIEAERAAPD